MPKHTVLLLLVCGYAHLAAAEPESTPKYQTQQIEGWTVHVRVELWQQERVATERALELLTRQLQEVVRVVPAPAVAKLREVPLWFSPAYPDVSPKAEYHPGAGWLREHQRDPRMERGVEFTNVRIFEQETRRMPNFALHELAHAYHHRVLPRGFENPELKAAYERAKGAGLYDRVERRDAQGRTREERAYAMTNPQEYFAETSEAFFSTNDFFPFDRTQLARHDPPMFTLLGKLWGTTDDHPSGKE